MRITRRSCRRPGQRAVFPVASVAGAAQLGVRQMKTAGTTSSHSDDRFKRAVERISAEVFWLRTYQNAINGMKGVDAIGLDFFRVSLNSLKEARLVRLIRVLEDKPRVASFWYLQKCNSGIVEAAANNGGLDLPELKAVAE
jgi:hypothetical protein